jgi:ribosomal protein S27AE
MAATNYKVDKPTNCTRCGKAIVQTKHGRKLYCYRCAVLSQQEHQHSYWVRKRENRKTPPTKNCHIDWTLGDKMIKDGEDPQVIADALKCSVHTVLSHRSQMKHGKIQYQPRVDYGCKFYDYKQELEKMLAELHAKRGNGMDMAQFRVWLMTEAGQTLLRRINEEGRI